MKSNRITSAGHSSNTLVGGSIVRKTLRIVTSKSHMTDNWIANYSGRLVLLVEKKNDCEIWIDGHCYNDCNSYKKYLSRPLKNVDLKPTPKKWWETILQKSDKNFDWYNQDWRKHERKELRQLKSGLS